MEKYYRSESKWLQVIIVLHCRGELQGTRMSSSSFTTSGTHCAATLRCGIGGQRAAEGAPGRCAQGSRKVASLPFLSHVFFLSRCTSILKPKIKRTPACRCWHHPFFPLFLKDITAPGNNMFKTFENKLSTLPTAPSLATPLALDLQFRCSTPLN